MSSYYPHPFVVLAVDPADVSGWSIFVEGRYHSSGVARSHEDRVRVVASAQNEAMFAKRKLVVVGEIWTPGGKFAGARTMQGIGAGWGKWLAVLELARHPKSRIRRVKVQTWRAAFATGRRMTSEDWDGEMLRRATSIAGRAPEDDNEADAVCIGWFATKWDGLMPAKLPAKGGRRG